MSWKILEILIAIVCVTSVTGAQETPEKQLVKRSYVCPPNFVRLSHRCYFFSGEQATWQEAYYQCQSMHSNLAIIKNNNQDKLIRKTLNRKTLEPLERWLGGVYDWHQKQWKWAASGKPLTYKGFAADENQKDNSLKWHCIIIDPSAQFRWSSRSCLERKHFICHKKLMTVTNRDKKKLLRQYNVNKLNEIPVPDIQGDILDKKSAANLKLHRPANLYQIELNKDLNAQYAYRTNKRKKNKKNKWKLPPPQIRQYTNGTIYVEKSAVDNSDVPTVVTVGSSYNRKRRNRIKDDELLKKPMGKLKWRTYKEMDIKHPLHPRPIVEEFNLVKER
ncbi:uncharacterized protein LOC132696705 isoform X2 [Cylas formicarius]|uniref:uncharacterized protein LOC132696705 isoform X2 n=1 Tax=Cylas formicarius TaxID=197179 RepID=UPI00295849DC|nr:uncharacterized protein LOC132696705 isoform X2 [Cylas formicarius]